MLTVKFPKLQKNIYYIALFVIYFLFLIRYYYGPDIATYVPYYEYSTTLEKASQGRVGNNFEIGYRVFNVLCNRLGLSYWGMTAVITTLYFIAISLLFKHIDRFRSFGLMVLVAFDYNLIYAENRQCLAVTFFIFGILLLQNKKYIWALFSLLVCAMMHKSGIFVVAMSLCYYLFSSWQLSKSIYQILAAILLALVFLPVSDFLLTFAQHLPLPDNLTASLAHHLSLGRQIQVVVIVYLLLLIAISHYTLYIEKDKASRIGFIALIGIVILVTLYQYYFLLNRIRSYFIPFIIVWVIRLISQKDTPIPYAALVRQTLASLLIVYSVFSAWSFYRMSNKLSCPLNEACTVFTLINNPAWAVRNHQMQMAEHFWRYDYMKDNQNKL